ncbi:MAG: hypothetical protein J6T15_04910 [Bacilli bacterium]|nr:hypothetical protein [Bacilli bacterium]
MKNRLDLDKVMSITTIIVAFIFLVLTIINLVVLDSERLRYFIFGGNAILIIFSCIRFWVIDSNMNKDFKEMTRAFRVIKDMHEDLYKENQEWEIITKKK